MKKVLITGCSSGFGLEIANHFLDRGWGLVATMRSPETDLFPQSENLQILPLDVTKQESIDQAVEAAGAIDVLVNNAGVGLLSAMEGTSQEQIRHIFETNTFGPMALIRSVLPQFRERKSGVIVNVSSTVTLKSIPLLSIYTASKHALNGFSQCLALELEPFNIQVRLVLPGRAPETSFGKNVQQMMDEFPPAYTDMAHQLLQSFGDSEGPVTESVDVAEAVWRAATDPSSPSRIPAGADAVIWAKEAMMSAATA